MTQIISILLSVIALTCTFTSQNGPLRADEPFRPEAGKFPPLENAHTYRGELIFVDHANRRGSIRVEGSGVFRKNDPHPFALLPYGVVRYHNAPADLRDIPLGTVMHVHAFLPPDPKISSVPVLPINNKEKDANHNRGAGIFPAENHVLLLEDEPSHCRRLGLTWKLKHLEMGNYQGTIVASKQSLTDDNSSVKNETMTYDTATRVWRGRELLTVHDLIADGSWPSSGRKNLNDQQVLLGITWKPTHSGIFTQFHISDIWIDGEAINRSSRNQTEVHKAFVRSRWMPAWVDSVEYGKFGQATITCTMFGGMDPTLYNDFKKGRRMAMAASENTLKHWAGGSAGTSQMAAKGSTLNIIKAKGQVPTGSSGIQIQFETDLITEGIRPTRVVRIRPDGWPDVHVPREEYLQDYKATHEDRFPTPAIFPSY